jgi:hypothetical protein
MALRTTLTIAQAWTRLRVMVRSIDAVAATQPINLAAIRPPVERVLELLAREPSLTMINEISDFLHLIEKFIARWRPSGRVRHYMQPSWAVDIDRDVQAAIQTLMAIPCARTEDSMKVFVSHSNSDRHIAAAFVDFIRAAVPMSAKDIRCTSVDGYKLPPGANADEQLRQEVFDSQVFIALLSPTSIASVYVLFELGARWGAKGFLVPIVVSGLTRGSLKAPLSAIHALDGTSEADLHQLVETLATRLSVAAENPAGYMKYLQAAISIAAKSQP